MKVLAKEKDYTVVKCEVCNGTGISQRVYEDGTCPSCFGNGVIYVMENDRAPSDAGKPTENEA